MHKITLNNIQVHAHHGCWEEEAIIGGDYRVDIIIATDFTLAAIGDDLSQTVDYVIVKEIVYREMAIRSKLIEHVAYRIREAMLNEIRGISGLKVIITKINAPMGGQVESVSVEMGE
jgi:dihydroneopterin aldolase